MTESDWLEQITANPKDVSTQLAYADWLRDRGEGSLANAWGWMARRGRFPVMLEWYNAAAYGNSDPNNLPEEVFEALPPTPVFAGCPGVGSTSARWPTPWPP